MAHGRLDRLSGVVAAVAAYWGIRTSEGEWQRIHDPLSGLQLHPRKTELQHYSKGVRFLGAVIKPGRMYVGKRTKGNFHNSIITHNAAAVGRVPSRAEQQAFLASMNSYLGLLRHYDTRCLRYAIVAKHVKGWWNYAEITAGAEKFVLRSRVREPLPSGSPRI